MTPMQIRLRAALAACLLLVSAVTAYAWRPTHRLADRESKLEVEAVFPKQFADWRADDSLPAQIVSPDTQAALNEFYAQVLSRVYIDSAGNRIMLSVAYGGDQSDATRAHRPEVCYPAQGFEILSKEDGAINSSSRSIVVRRLVARLNARVEPITYWMTVGDQVSVTNSQIKWHQMKYGLQGLIPDGMLVRVSSISGDADAAYKVQARFIDQMVNAIAPGFVARVAGTQRS